MTFNRTIIAALAFATAGAANANIVTSETNFDSAASGSGWNGAWNLVAGTTKNPAPASIANSSLVFTGNADNAAVRKLDGVQTSDVFVDFSLQYSGVLGGNDFVGLWFGNSNGPSIGLKANCGDTSATPKCSNDFFVRTGGSDGFFLAGSDLVAGQSYQLFGHLYKSGDKGNDYDRFDAWFKDNTTGAVSSVITATGNNSLTQFDTLGFRSVNIDNKVAVTIDSLRVSEVPEPGSLALMGLAFAGFAAARRRKRG
jgi:hypothetical protein